ncbi:MAG TPA: hypothetical protein VIA18_28705 [Polyangia bacterium]|nr:hypothetical protein [Polyangia bacterium]
MSQAALAVVESAPASETPPAAEWSLARRVVFRFAFLYWSLYCFSISSQIPGASDVYGDKFCDRWARACAFLAHRIFHVAGDVTVTNTGSGDRIVDWVNLAVITTLAVVGTIVWSALSKRREHEKLRAGLRVFLRYTVGLIMLSYGTIKVLGGQFPAPSVARLLQPVGKMTPMSLMWTFMGASPAYIIFSGVGETVGALLVMFRRTATLGALVLAGVLTNVVMMNLCYDVPVKINSTHFLAMCVFIMLPDLERLGSVLVFHRATAAVPWRRSFASRRARIANYVVKALIVGGVGGYTFYSSAKEMTAYYHVTHPWIDGYWAVKRFVRNGHEVPALLDDNTRWNRLRFDSFDGKHAMRWHFIDGKVSDLYDDKLDGATLTLTASEPKPGTKAAQYPLAFAKIDDDHFRISGKVAGDDIVAEVERLKASDMPLVTRGFHFVNEAPYAR